MTEHSLTEFCELPRFDNWMTRLLSGHVSILFPTVNNFLYQLAINNLKRAFFFVGFTERLPESVDAFSKICGYDKFVYDLDFRNTRQDNNARVGRTVLSKELLSSKDRRRLEQSHRFDLRLYSVAAEYFAPGTGLPSHKRSEMSVKGTK